MKMGDGILLKDVKTQQFRHPAFISYEENWASSRGKRRSYRNRVPLINK